MTNFQKLYTIKILVTINDTQFFSVTHFYYILKNKTKKYLINGFMN